MTASGDALPGRDLTVLFAQDKGGLGAEAVTVRRSEDAGYFLLFAMPWQERARRAPADVIFALDVSGSMSGPKIEQARRSLLDCLDRLGPEDRFAIVTFSSAVSTFRDRLARATPGALGEAREFVRDLEAGGGTDLADGLDQALRLARDGNDPMVVLLTDGLPTVGLTSLADIEAHARERRMTGAHLFTFGVGYDVNAPFLDRLAADGRGASDYVKPEEDIEEKVSALFGKITSPVLHGVTVSVEGARTFDLCPRVTPDLFRGEQLVVLGRYEGRGDARAVVRGTTPDGRRVEVRVPMDLDPPRGRNGYVPTLWASRRIATLMDQARLEGETPGLREEIVGLSREYGILTPYTSYYVGDESAPLAASAEVGERAVERSVNIAERKAAFSLDRVLGAPRAAAPTPGAGGPAPYSLPGGGSGTPAPPTGGLVSASGRLFESRNGVWTDMRHREGQRVLRVAPWSDAYLSLLARHPDLAGAAALGGHVLLAGRGLSIEIVEGGRTNLTDAEWREVERAFG